MDRPSIGSSLSLAEVRRQALQRLEATYPLTEAQAMVRTLLRHFLPGWETLWLISRGAAPFPADRLPDWEAALTAAAQGHPLAYILGYTEFLEHRICINPGVFIPRPETEEWIARTIQHFSASPPRRLLEVGSGSGALLVALGKAFPQTTLFAIDKNPQAIRLTHQNCQAHGLAVFAAVHDFLKAPMPADWASMQWNLIISNPPYVPFADSELVAPNVRAYEPPEAVFCEEIEFYEQLGKLALENLSPGGTLIVELYPPTADRVRDLYQRFGLTATLYRDLSGRWRWLAASAKKKVRIFGAVSGSSSAR